MLEMETLNTSEALEEGSVVSELDEGQNPCDKTLEEASGLSGLSRGTGLVLACEVSAGENGSGFSFTSNNVEMNNVKAINSFLLGEVQKDYLGDESVAEGSPMESGSLESDSERKRLVLPHSNGMEINEGSVIEVGPKISGREEIGVEKVVMGKDMEEEIAPLLHGVDSTKNIEVSGDGISLFVEVFGPLNGIFEGDDANDITDHALNGSESDQENKHKGIRLLLPVNEEYPIAKSSEIHEGVLDEAKNSPVEGKAKEELDNGDPEYQFSEGDLVWVKTKAQSWWPGLIYNPSGASKDVTKSDQRSCHLVKYFGNGNCVWCSPSQCKPFLECFDQMSKQSDSRNFVVAVEKAVGVIGRRVNMEMTCPCWLTALLATGIKEGTSVSENKTGELCEFSATQFEPATFLAFIKNLALDVSMPGMIEFTVIQNCLFAFDRSIGHHQLPMHKLRPTGDAKDSIPDGLTSEKKDENLTKFCGGDSEIVLQKCGRGVAEERIISSDTEIESRKGESNGSDGTDLGGCKMAACEVVMTSLLKPPKAMEGGESGIGNSDGGTEERSDKGYETRERKRSKYLSPPFVNLSWSGKDAPTSGEHEKEDRKEVSHVGVDMNKPAGQSVGSTPMVECSGKKSRKKLSRKPVAGHGVLNKPVEINASCAELLYELRFTALDCLYASKRRYFDSVERFFSEFRRFVFHDKFNNEMPTVHTVVQQEPNLEINCLQTLPNLMEKEIGMEEANVEHLSTIKTSGKPDANKVTNSINSAGEVMNYSSSNVVRKRGRKKKEKATLVVLETTPIAGLSGMNENTTTSGSMIINFQQTGLQAPIGGTMLKKRKEEVRGTPNTGLSGMNGNTTTSGSMIINFQQMGLQAPADGSMLKKRKEEVRGTPTAGLLGMNRDITTSGSMIINFQQTGLPQTKIMAEIPDLNGNNASLSVEDMQITGPVASQGKLQPKRRKSSEAAASEHAKTQSSKLAPFLKDVPVGVVYSLQSIDELNGREQMNEAASLCLNTVLTAGQPGANGNNAEPSSLVRDSLLMGPLSSGGKPECKKRKRKEKASDSLKSTVTCSIPDLNGNVTEPSSMGKDLPYTNCILPEAKPQRKRRRRSKAGAGMPNVIVNYSKMPTNEEALGTALLLNFAPGSPLPSREVLVATFCGFGPLKESETRMLNDVSAQIVFSRSSDAGNALQSLEKSSPFGPALLSYRLHHLSAAATILSFPPMDRFKSPANPPGFKPHQHQGEAPDLLHIRQNLEMMTSTMEKSGDNLSPEMRAKLESEIKGLLTKVSTMVGSSSSS
ncbi:unnamed protein product [Ilex paraguariensis]|uniref:PWWP domain-containing protein n=1 Tax=Ilex paraguariensis TaxID=185542 RepID=A0ABC8T9W2_9AQUA